MGWGGRGRGRSSEGGRRGGRKGDEVVVDEEAGTLDWKRGYGGDEARMMMMAVSMGSGGWMSFVGVSGIFTCALYTPLFCFILLLLFNGVCTSAMMGFDDDAYDGEVGAVCRYVIADKSTETVSKEYFALVLQGRLFCAQHSAMYH